MFNTNEIDNAFEKLGQANADYQKAVEPLPKLIRDLEKALEKIEGKSLN